jgi:hypothetical protein
VLTFSETINLMSAVKAYSEDQPRDEHGRWEGGNASHPDVMEHHEGSSISQAMSDIPNHMEESSTSIEDARQELENASDEAEQTADEEGDILEEHGPESKQYAAWEKSNTTAMQNVADKTMALHEAVS